MKRKHNVKDARKFVLDHIRDNASKLDTRKQLEKVLIKRGYTRERASIILTQTSRDPRIFKYPKYVQTRAFDLIRRQNKGRSAEA